MVRKTELAGPLSRYFHRRYPRKRYHILIHQDDLGKGTERPDMVVVIAPVSPLAKEEPGTIVVEIVTSIRRAVRRPDSGLNKLSRCPARERFLAVPEALLQGEGFRAVRRRCREMGMGILIVDPGTGRVACRVKPESYVDPHALRRYPDVIGAWYDRGRRKGRRYKRIRSYEYVEAKK